MDVEMINNLSKQINNSLKAMDKTKNLEEKVKHSLIVKNLCESMGVFLKSMADMQNIANEYGDEIDDEFDDEENDDDDDKSIIPF